MRIFILMGLFFLTACGNTGSHYKYEFAKRGLVIPENRESFPHCRGYGCKYVSNVYLTRKEWRDITAPMRPFFDMPQQERDAVAATIGRFERVVGEKTGTAGDIKGTFDRLGDDQLDCVDESVNTTIYLVLMNNAKLIKFHDIIRPATRSPLLHPVGWPHKTAVIRDKETDERFVVDSWFHDNGHAAEIVLLDKWKMGWKPEKDN